MINVSYSIDLFVRGPLGQQKVEQTQFFGSLAQVKDDLEKAVSQLTKMIVMVVADDIALAVAEIKRNILDALLTHDMQNVPVYPQFGSSPFQNLHRGVGFQGVIRVSKRLIEETVPEPTASPIKILGL